MEAKAAYLELPYMAVTEDNNYAPAYLRTFVQRDENGKVKAKWPSLGQASMMLNERIVELWPPHIDDVSAALDGKKLPPPKRPTPSQMQMMSVDDATEMVEKALQNVPVGMRKAVLAICKADPSKDVSWKIVMYVDGKPRVIGNSKGATKSEAIQNYKRQHPEITDKLDAKRNQ
jgi:hypothetical protein